MHYGSRAKDWIVDHDVKQKVLAKEFHVTESILSQYLTGRSTISVDVLVKIARYFNLSMDYLVGLTDLPERPMELSEEEGALVESFRSLDEKQRTFLLAMLRVLREQR